MLRWGVQQGRSVIPKSTKPARIAENLDVFDFELTGDELAAIDRLDTGQRGGPEPEVITLEVVRPTHPRGLRHIVDPLRRPSRRTLLHSGLLLGLGGLTQALAGCTSPAGPPPAETANLSRLDSDRR